MLSDASKIKLKACEISLSDHCNLKCAGCSHASPHLPKRLTEIETIERDLTALSQVLHASELRIAGGEPLLHSQLLDILHIARRSGVADTLTIISNGVLLRRAPEGMWDAIDHLRISAYPGIKLSLARDELSRLSQQHGFDLTINDIGIFNSVFLNRKLPTPLARFVYQNCTVAHRSRCNLVYEGRIYKCPEAAFMEERLALLGVDFRNKQHDSVALHDNPNLKDQLQAYLESKRNPLMACSYCMGTIGKEFPQTQLDKASAKHELKPEHRYFWSLISPRQLVYSYLENHQKTYHVAKRVKKLLGL